MHYLELIPSCMGFLDLLGEPKFKIMARPFLPFVLEFKLYFEGPGALKHSR